MGEGLFVVPPMAVEANPLNIPEPVSLSSRTRLPEPHSLEELEQEVVSFMVARIGESPLHPAVFVDPQTSLQEAAATMQARHTSALLVRRGEQLGIFTGRDVREKSLLQHLADSTPVGEIASYDLLTLERDDFLFNALALMIKYSIRHLVITQAQEIIGILEQIDLLNYLSRHSYFFADQIDQALTQVELKQAGDYIPRLIQTLADRGVKPRYIAQLVNDLNQRMFRRLYEQSVPDSLRDDACLIIMGSEGRGEQLLRTDQDNAVIFRNELVCTAFAEKSRHFTEALITLGYPRCPGNVMVSNPDWAKSLSAYKNDLFRWIHQPDKDAFLNLAIFFDATAVAGDPGLLAELKNYLFELIQDRTVVVRHFARAIQAFPTPLGLFSRFVLEKVPPNQQALDIKKGGIFPIVQGVRSLALEYRLSETNTIDRIQQLRGKGPFDNRFAADLIEAFDFMSLLRLRVHLARWKQGLAGDNYINPGELNTLEQHLLRDSLKIVDKFKSLIGYHFKLSLMS